jgi:hypothetical protein
VTSTLIRRSPSSAAAAAVPALYAPTAQAAKRFIEYFAAHIRNPNTRRAYFHAVLEFSRWCEAQNFTEIVDIEPLHVAAYIEQLGQRLAKPSVKQHLAAIRMLFDWLVVGQVVATNPAAPVRGPKYTVRKGKTPVLAQEEARELLDAIDISTVVGLRDRALIATMIYTFGRVGGGPEGPKQHAAAQQSRLAQPLRRVEGRAQRVSNGVPARRDTAWWGQKEQGKHALPRFLA